MKNYKQAVDIWFRFYEEKTGLKYRFTPKDGSHLKLLLHYFEQDLKQWEDFLYSIKDDWVLEHLELGIVNSKLNSLMQAKNAKPKIQKKFIDTFDTNYLKTLSPQDTVLYYRHLRNLGYKAEMSRTGAVIGFKSAEA